MSKRRRYRALRRGNLFLIRAAAGSGQGASVVLRLLIDTGSTHTVLPVEVLESLGCDTHHPLSRLSITAASGTIVAPQVALEWFHCLGHRIRDFQVVAHTLPVGTYVDGLLGMGFLVRSRATISAADGSITVADPEQHYAAALLVSSPRLFLNLCRICHGRPASAGDALCS